MATKFLECHHEARYIHLTHATQDTTYYITSCDVCSTVFKKVGIKELTKIPLGKCVGKSGMTN